MDYDETFSVKIIMVGSLNVGKSSLMAKYATGITDKKVNSKNLSYVIKTKKVNWIKFQLKLWDTAGQEKFKSLTKLFTNEAKIAILIYSIDNEESFNDLDEWLKLIKSSNEDSVIYGLCANKSDLASANTIPDEKGIEYAKKIGAEWASTSAIINGKGIDKIVEILFIEYYQKYFNFRSARDSLNSQNTLNRGFYQESKSKKGCCWRLANNNIDNNYKN